MGERARAVRRRFLRRRAPRMALTWPPGWPHRASGRTLAVCHPHWRGVRTAAHAHGDPVVETEDTAVNAGAIVDAALAAGVEVLVVHGFPPGTEVLLSRAHAVGIATRAVVHSSPAQHGAERWEALAVDRLVDLSTNGILGRLGFVKAGVAEAFTAIGVPAAYTPNRAPRMPQLDRLDLGRGSPHVGVFAAPFWRKNVVTQLAALSLIEGSVGHVLSRPDVAYLDRVDVVEHGVQDWEQFIRLQASVDLNLYVTLSECHPLSPVESYLSGVPCLVSRTSVLFRDDADLWDLVTVSEADNPVAIAAGAHRLLDRRDEAVTRALAWIEDADAKASASWADFLS